MAAVQGDRLGHLTYQSRGRVCCMGGSCCGQRRLLGTAGGHGHIPSSLQHPGPFPLDVLGSSPVGTERGLRMPCASRPASNHRAPGPWAPSHADLVLVPGDSIAEGAETSLHPGGAPVTSLHLAGSILTPEGGKVDEEGQQAQRAILSHSHTSPLGSTCHPPRPRPHGLLLLSHPFCGPQLSPFSLSHIHSTDMGGCLQSSRNHRD